MNLLARLLCLTGLLLFGCSGDSTATTKSTLIVGSTIDPDNANPLVAPYALSGYIIDLVNPGLARRRVGPGGLEYEPALAKSWSFNEALTELTYHLRDDIFWEDGVPFTSADVAFTMDLMADPDVASNWLGDTKNIQAVLTPDDHTVVFQFKEPRNPIWQQGYTFRGILPKHKLADVDRGSLRGHKSARDPLAIGPYRIKEWKRNQHLILEPNPRAPADWSPTVQHIILKIMPESQTQILALLKRELDFVMSLQLGDVPAVEKNPNLRTIITPSNAMTYIGYNLTRPQYQDLRVRKALALATDRDALIEKLFRIGDKTYARTCEATVAPTLGDWYASDLTPTPYDPEQAKALLTEAGWVDSDGDGFRDKNGDPLRIRLMMQSANEEGRKITILVQAQWRKIGVDLQIESLDATAFDDRARKREYDALLWSFGNNPKVDLPIIWRSDGRYNWFGYNNPIVDQWLDKGVSSVQPADAQHAFKEAQRQIHADMPVTFLLWIDEVMAIDKGFQNVTHSPFNPLFHAERWTFTEPASAN